MVTLFPSERFSRAHTSQYTDLHSKAGRKEDSKIPYDTSSKPTPNIHHQRDDESSLSTPPVRCDAAWLPACRSGRLLESARPARPGPAARRPWRSLPRAIDRLLRAVKRTGVETVAGLGRYSLYSLYDVPRARIALCGGQAKATCAVHVVTRTQNKAISASGPRGPYRYGPVRPSQRRSLTSGLAAPADGDDDNDTTATTTMPYYVLP